MALLTVYQMKQDRRAAYQPDILINPLQVSFTWDSDGLDTWIDVDEDDSVSEFHQNSDGTYSGKMRFRIQSLVNGAFDLLPLANIGVRSANDINFTWDASNSQQLINVLLECDPSLSAFCTIGENFTVFS